VLPDRPIRFAAGLCFLKLRGITAALFIINLIIPDMIPLAGKNV
jgi:hypothetical protein